MIVHGYTLPLSLALDTPSQDTVFHQMYARRAEPVGAGFVALGNGVRQLRVIPFSNGSPGQVFNFRLLGWSRIGGKDPNREVWLGIPIVVLSCTTGKVSGLSASANPYDGSPGLSMRILKETHRLCDSLKVVSGSLANSQAAVGVVAQAFIDAGVYQVYSFEFCSDQNIAMNALWSMA